MSRLHEKPGVWLDTPGSWINERRYQMTKQERENFKGCYVESINNVIRDAVEITEMSGRSITTTNVIRTLYDVVDRLKEEHGSINLMDYLV